MNGTTKNQELAGADAGNVEDLLGKVRDLQGKGVMLGAIELWDKALTQFKENEAWLQTSNATKTDHEMHHQLNQSLLESGEALKTGICPDGIERDWPILNQINSNLAYLERYAERWAVTQSPPAEELQPTPTDTETMEDAEALEEVDERDEPQAPLA